MRTKRRTEVSAAEPAAMPRLLRIHGTVAREIGMAIVSGKLQPGEVLDREIEASSRRNISRTAYREAIRTLNAKGLITSRPHHGTCVSKMSDWHLLDPDVLRWLFCQAPRPEVLLALFELRELVEPAAAALAARRRTDAQVNTMRRALDEMARHTLHRPGGRWADQAFHAALLDATANPFVMSLANGVTSAVDALTQYKMSLTRLERDPVPDHCRVLDAIAAKDAEGARFAMSELLRLAILDLPPSHRRRE